MPTRVPTIKELRKSLEHILGEGSFSYFEESVIEHHDGWSFRFDASGFIRSQELLNGSWWDDWIASSCPLLLMQGEKSPILSWEHAQKMAMRRTNTMLKQFPGCGHTIRNGDPYGYQVAIKSFLSINL
ncbi:alpha/beta fold hydrolase [Paenibacillus sedimenti]|uniref:Alpha/beta hydrolase n=1 Tax=Paenibacillus sedimenti TaxID=2770274 RepID=A0A926QLC3_9BACL|nr:alpha/beta hydrolase [Paenibacillus sedimenti]MBD0383756.1 alpha/beta hydrolase [Paenibacillus sedimenti]